MTTATKKGGLAELHYLERYSGRPLRPEELSRAEALVEELFARI